MTITLEDGLIYVLFCFIVLFCTIFFTIVDIDIMLWTSGQTATVEVVIAASVSSLSSRPSSFSCHLDFFLLLSSRPRSSFARLPPEGRKNGVSGEISRLRSR